MTKPPSESPPSPLPFAGVAAPHGLTPAHARPAVSQHLKVLRDAGLVTDAKDGSRRLYSVNPRGVAGMRDYLDRFWSGALDAFETAARTEEEK